MENINYCLECQVKEHPICSLTEGCPCCEDTRQAMSLDQELE